MYLHSLLNEELNENLKKKITNYYASSDRSLFLYTQVMVLQDTG